MRAFLTGGATLLVMLASAECPAQEAKNGFAEIIGSVQNWRQSGVIRTPWNQNSDKGGYGKKLRGLDRRTNFTFGIKSGRDVVIYTLETKEEDRKPYRIEKGKVYRIFNRPVTTWNKFQCSFTVRDLAVDWAERPEVRVVVAAEANYSSFRPEKDKHPTALCAYLIQVRPAGKNSDLPPEHWPVWYVNNWIHFARKVIPTLHYRYMANYGFNFWSWGVFDPPPNLKGNPEVGVYRLLRHPETGGVSSVVLHTPGCCELEGVSEEHVRYSRPPVVIAKAGTNSGKPPLKVNFKGKATDPDGDEILWYTWDFDASDGAGNDSVGTEVSHTYQRAGKYVVSLTAMDSSGRPGRDHLRICVGEE